MNNGQVAEKLAVISVCFKVAKIAHAGLEGIISNLSSLKNFSWDNLINSPKSTGWKTDLESVTT